MEKKTVKRYSGQALENKRAAIQKAREAKRVKYELSLLEAKKPLTLWERMKKAVGF